MVIDNFDLIGAGIRPHEADSILIIDANAVLALAIADESLQAISRRNTQFV